MKYSATTVVSFPAGAELGLSKEQAALRGHCIVPHAKRKGWFTTTGPLQFKVGEQFHYDGEMPKAMASMMEPVGKELSKAEQDAKAKAAALEAAVLAVSDAEAALANASTDAARADATTQLDQARQALAELKG